jgi:hypothetical protein
LVTRKPLLLLNLKPLMLKSKRLLNNFFDSYTYI